MGHKARYFLIWGSVLLASLGCLGGCSKKQQEKKENCAPLLKIPILSDYPSLDPHCLAARLSSSTFAKWIFEGLTRLTPEGNYELAGAQSVEISPCQMRYTFTLKPNGYSNGERVLAQDYEDAWKKAVAPTSNCAKASFFYCIKNAEAIKNGQAPLESLGVKAEDDNTLIVHLEHPAPYFLRLVSSPLFAPFKIQEGEVLLNRPYSVSERKPNDYLLLKGNPFFWDASRIKVPSVKICIVQDPSTVFSLYQKKEVDLIGGPFNLISSDILSAEIPKGTFSKQGENISLPFWVCLNTKSLPLSSSFIRQALSYAMDRNEISKHVLIGDEPLFKPFPDGACYEESSYDPVKANRLFEKGLAELGLTRETFPPLKLSSCNFLFHRKFSEYMQEKWQRVLGIQVDLEVQEWAAFYHDMVTGNYQLGGILISSEHNDPLAYLELLSNGSHYSTWKFLPYQKLISQIKQEKKSLQRENLIEQAKTILNKEMPIIAVINRSQYYSYRSDLKGLCFDHLGLLDLSYAHFEQDDQKTQNESQGFHRR